MRKTLTTEQLLRSLGATGKLTGFQCTVYMLDRIKEDPSQLQLITKRLYRDAAMQFGTSAVAVERNLRTVVRYCWNRSDHRLWKHIAGTSLQVPPTNSEFLDMLSSYLREIAN